MSVERDVVVVGAGPAGCAAAYVCASAGLDVLLVERQRLPRSKVCGCCLDPAAIASLRRLGVEERLAGAWLPLQRAEVHAWGRYGELAVGGVVLSRERLDTELAEHARRAGAELVHPVRARLGDLEGGRRTVELAPVGTGERQLVRARLVVVACGLGGLERIGGAGGAAPGGARRVGLGATLTGGDLPPGTLRMAAASDGYVGLVRLEDGRLDAAASVRTAALECESPARVVARVQREAGAPPLPPGLEWRGTPSLRRTPAGDPDRVVTVGDAAGFWEPFTGEGIGWALEAGERVERSARRLAAGKHPEGSPGMDVEARIWLLRRQLRSRAVAWLAGGRWRSRIALATAQRLPALARLGSRRIGFDRERAA